jgi:hypothetical protein
LIDIEEKQGVDKSKITFDFEKYELDDIRKTNRTSGLKNIISDKQKDFLDINFQFNEFL